MRPDWADARPSELVFMPADLVSTSADASAKLDDLNCVLGAHA